MKLEVQDLIMVTGKCRVAGWAFVQPDFGRIEGDAKSYIFYIKKYI